MGATPCSRRRRTRSTRRLWRSVRSADESWGVRDRCRVRMGVHTGEASIRDGDYYGTAVNRAARIMSVGHGGQILVSHATEQLVRDALPDGCALRISVTTAAGLIVPKRCSS